MDDRLMAGNRRPVQKREAVQGWTQKKRRQFLIELADSCNVHRAAAKVGMNKSGAYQLRKRDAAFAALWAEALEIGYERLENALLEHALIGVNAIDMDAVRDGVADREDADRDGVNGDAKGGEARRVVPGSGFSARALTPANIQLALSLLNRHRQSVEGKPIQRGRKRATPAETDAALKKQLDALARKLETRGKGDAGA